MDKQDIPVTPNIISDKKKRGRKKNIVVENTNSSNNQNHEQSQSILVKENKKERKKRTTKCDNQKNNIITNAILETANENENDNDNEPLIKKRKRRTRKDIENSQNVNKNIMISLNNNNDTSCSHLKLDNNDNNDNDNDNDNDNKPNDCEPKEEKVAKKRGRKPKGGKITIQPHTNINIQNELPNIILHLKCSLSDLNKNNIEMTDTFDLKNNNALHNNSNNNDSNNNDSNNNNSDISNSSAIESIQSYNSLHKIGSEINNGMTREGNNSSISSYNISLCHRDMLKKTQPLSNVHNMITKDDNITKDNAISLNETYSSATFRVYDPSISNDTFSNSLPLPIPCNAHCYDTANQMNQMNQVNQIVNKNTASLFSTIYSPDIISYNNAHASTHDDVSLLNSTSLNERDIWKKVNQLKLSFHKSDICQNIRGAQRSACFWCTCEFDSPAIYIPKSMLKDMYNVYGCFCSPECAAAFLMNESIDTSTKFERYHLLNSLYGKIYKYEKSIKIAPNPYYLLNKFYGTLTIQEYRKLFQSDQMIYVVNKPLTHILPELYEDNNDFLLNNKIIPTNSINLKKKVLKSNV